MIEPEEIITFEELHHRLAKRSLTKYKGNITHASKAMGVSRRCMKRWMNSFKIDIKEYENKHRKTKTKAV